MSPDRPGDLRVPDLDPELLIGVVQAAPDAVVAVDAQGRIVIANGRAEEMFGYGRGELLGQPIERLVPERFRAEHVAAREGYTVAAALRAMRAVLELTARRKDGSEVPVEIASSPVQTERGLVVASIIRDVTERRRADRFAREQRERLAESERFLRVAFDAIPANVAVLDERGTIQRVNSAWIRFARQNALPGAGPPPEFGPSENYLAVCDRATGPDSSTAKAMAAGIRAVARGEVPEFSIEYPCHSPDEERWFLARVTRFQGPGPTHVLVAHLNVTERRRREEERATLLASEHAARVAAQEAVRARDAFISMASHELKNPLGALALEIALMRRQVDTGGDGRLANRLEAAKRQVGRMAKLVDHLLDVSRITAGRLDVELEDVDLAAVVKEVVARSEHEISRSGSILTLGADAPIVGRWDPLRLDQIVTNLLSNALKYGRGKPIEVAVAADADLSRLTVKDHGIGIAPEDQTRIFERFERAADERSFSGFGLGLWIVRQIVEAMGGKIGVKSRLGEGSTFVVELPRREAVRSAA